MYKQYFSPIIIFFLLLILQTTVIPLVSISGVIPDLVLIALIFFTLKHGQIYGTILGSVYGLLFDLITGSLLGSAMFSKTLTGFIGGFFYNENKIEIYLNSYVFSLIVLLCAVIDSAVYSFFSSVDFNTNIVLLFFEQGLLPGLYTAVVSTVVVIFHPRRRSF